MKKTILSILVFLGLLTGCNPNQVDNSPALPTPSVPSLEDVEYAQSLWENSDVENYYLIVKETTSDGSREIRLVVEGGEVIAAQEVIKQGGSTVSATAMPLEEAEQYQIENLLEQVHMDAAGEGEAKVDMEAHFDATLGYPVLIYAEGIISYTEEGNLKLNSDYSYSYVTTFDLLLEDIYGVGKDTLLTLKRSGGEEAWCDTLRVYEDGTAMYTNNCDQALLNMKPPFSDFEKLTALLNGFSGLEEVVEEMGGNLELSVTGSGAGEITSEEYEKLWALVDRFTDLLTNPVGEGLTLLYSNSNNFYGLNMLTLMGQPATMPIVGSLQGGVVNQAHNLLIIADDNGISSFNLEDGTTTAVVINPDGKAPYIPLAIDDAGYILLSRMVNETHQELAWFNITDHKLKRIEGNEIHLGCELAVEVIKPGKMLVSSATGSCTGDNLTKGLYRLDLSSANFELVADLEQEVTDPAYLEETGQVLFTMPAGDVSGLFLMNLDDETYQALDDLPDGNVVSPVWDTAEQFYFSIQEGSNNGIYFYDLIAAGSTFIFELSAVETISLSPNGEFLLFYDADMDLNAYTFTRAEVLPVDFSNSETYPLFVGWLVAEEE